ncbi:two-component sensor histidine kinase [Trueperella sp. HMSC08B05]|uniref:histidine kinase n=1 Tax=Trueperella bernardiae TaxID=59561 RepID=A0AAW6ZLU4_9ACTO|nr:MULTISPECIES: HAMP domain-containing sensor histidine kinase [Trueperella]MDK8602503.1 HAMP domain-containing sensor histidine kinase [Trueperella bernardiae]MDV6238372.1 HAMP domain-containing sensor histidine kinase [Trueperella bernardiae]OCW60428.1 histidine kinase [Trueperella bernardiae]OFS67108.1 two-component sensor histidine kinase [Trueperella sp. HMSC08H06]OFS74512.1 two-component sensor histidine kinase [Trueperella sp. HMSC08B05]
MRRRAIAMTTAAVAVAVLILGLPGIMFAVSLVWQQVHTELSDRATAVSTVVERVAADDLYISESLLTRLATNGNPDNAHIVVNYPDGTRVESDTKEPPYSLEQSVVNAAGVLVTVEVPRADILQKIGLMVAGAVGLIFVAFVAGVTLAMKQSRKISAPLIYLAAAAEQLGAGRVRPQIRQSGIEEIDLISDEIARSADRMAGRLAKERQFAADAAHQLRTPLAALSMRIEEIEFLTDDEEIIEEVHKSLEQIDRLTGVVSELMATSQSESGGTTEAIAVSRAFNRIRDEWTKPYQREGRQLVLDQDFDGAVLATPGSLSQILATLVENSLKYGAGTTSVSAASAGKSVIFKVRDEGPGVSAEDAEDVFEKGYSTGGSTGIGLAVAKELAEIDGGRLELTNKAHAEFTLTLSALPKSLDPNKVLPHGAIMTVGARRGRR